MNFFANVTPIAAVVEFQSDPVFCLSYCSVCDNHVTMTAILLVTMVEMTRLIIIIFYSPTFIFLNSGDFSCCLYHIAGPLSQLDSVKIECEKKMQYQHDQSSTKQDHDHLQIISFLLDYFSKSSFITGFQQFRQFFLATDHLTP